MGRNYYLNEDPSKNAVRFKDLYKFLTLGEVLFVDQEEMTVDLQFIDISGTRAKVPIGQAYTSRRGFVGALPAIGSLAIVGWFRDTGYHARPVVIGFLPRGFQSGLKAEPIKDRFNKVVRHRFRKLFPGNALVASDQGGDILVDENILLSNKQLNSLELRSYDQALITNTVQTYLNNQASRLRSGIIYRDPLYSASTGEIINLENNDGTQVEPIYLPNGKILYVITVTGKTFDAKSEAYTEHILQVKESAGGILDVSTQDLGLDVPDADGTINNFIVVQGFGNLVGDDNRENDVGTYGKLLKPQIFESRDSWKVINEAVACEKNDELDENKFLAACYWLMFPQSRTNFFVDKEGKFHANIAKSSSASYGGGGVSADINMDGGIKLKLGKAEQNGTSINGYMEGSINLVLGGDSGENIRGRSLDLTARKAINIDVTGTDLNGESYGLSAVGNVRETINGDKFVEVQGNYIVQVSGIYEEKILGTKKENFVNNRNIAYGGNFGQSVVGTFSSQVGQGKEEYVGAGDDEQTILAGDKSETILLGNFIRTALAGNIEETLLLGNKTIDIVVGDYDLNVGVGDINIKTNVGNINMRSTAGQAEIKASLGVTIDGTTLVQVKGSIIKLNNMNGGVVTGLPNSSDFHDISGRPMTGRANILA